MLNSKPGSSKYRNGNFIPKNKDKVIKLNTQGGLYYRSSWELRIMTWLDNNSDICKWGAECMRIPYQMTHLTDGDLKVKEHTYFPDFYYEIRLPDGNTRQVVAEVKPQKDYDDALMFSEGKFSIPPNITLKKLQSLEYRFKMAQKNKNKWETMIKWCDKKGYNFIVITENHLKKFGV